MKTMKRIEVKDAGDSTPGGIWKAFVIFAALLLVFSVPASGWAQSGGMQQGGQGGMQGGMPPGGQGGMPQGGQGGMMGPPPGGGSSNYTLSGAYTVDGTTETASDKVITSDKEDVSGVYVVNNGKLTMTNPTVTTSGNSSSMDNSSFHGLNAVVLADKGGEITIKGGTLSSTGTGANGAMAVDSKAVINLTDVKIKATGGGGHGVMATQGGTINITNVDMETDGRSGAPIATDRGGGTINVQGGRVISAGGGSPAIYSTGVVNAKDLKGTATGSEGVVIEGKNQVNLTDCNITGSKLDGVMIYQSMSGDAEMGIAEYTMKGGSLSAAAGPLFLITNTKTEVLFSNVKTENPSGVLIEAAAKRWGNSGSNGGNLIFIADRQTLNGDIQVDAISTVDLTLKNNSKLTGAVNSDGKGKEMKLTIDKSSTWEVTGDSNLTGLEDKDGISGGTISNIIGNGHTVYYDQKTASSLKGKTYTLAKGGELTPKK